MTHLTDAEADAVTRCHIEGGGAKQARELVEQIAARIATETWESALVEAEMLARREAPIGVASDYERGADYTARRIVRIIRDLRAEADR